MITKGIIEKVDGYKALVRLPIYNSSSESKHGTKTNDLPSATICSLPNVENPFAVGDVVFVGFEDNDTNKPIILGHLYTPRGNQGTPGLNLSTLNTTSTTKLSANTHIGKVNPSEILALSGIKGNIQKQIDNLKSTAQQIVLSSGSEGGSDGSEVDLSEIKQALQQETQQRKLQDNLLINRITQTESALAQAFTTKANLTQTGGLQLKSGALEFDDDSNTFWTSSNLNIGGNINAVGTIYQNGKELAEKDHTHSNYLTLTDTQTLIDNSISNLVANAPTTLDTLKELADAVQENKNLIETIESSTSTMIIRRWR